MIRSYRRHADVLLVLLLSAALSGAARAQVPHTLNYQGYLTNAASQPLNKIKDRLIKRLEAKSSEVDHLKKKLAAIEAKLGLK